jgi:hypothetical protein
MPYWRSLFPDESSENAASEDPMDWPDGPRRRLRLGHSDEKYVPGYCTCGELTTLCSARPREWLSSHWWRE